MASIPWYARYDDIRQEVEESQASFHERCRVLGTHPDTTIAEVWRELIARAVHESNWQEGVYLDEPRTRELTDEAFDNLPIIKGPHLNLDAIVHKHREHVVQLKRKRASTEEIATYNLSTAHHLIRHIGSELADRQTVSIVQALREVITKTKNEPSLNNKIPVDLLQAIEDADMKLNDLLNSNDPIEKPLTQSISTSGEFYTQLLDIDPEHLMNPMHPAYLHCLHRIALMGILHPRYLGTFRHVPVNIGLESVYFPPAPLIPGLIDEYCKKFPSVKPRVTKYDGILKSAGISYNFVAIHPYVDGNGRISRLLMNIILWGKQHPPVYLKADKKSRHRYAQALRRANKGNIKPLACLIAISLKEIYDSLLSAINQSY